MVKNRVPKTALYTKPVYAKDKGVSITKAKVVERDANGEILQVTFKIDNRPFTTNPSMAEKLRRQALTIANKNMRKYGTKVYNKKGEVEKIKVNKKVREIIKQKTAIPTAMYNRQKRSIFIDNILRKSGITMNDTMKMYIQGNKDLEDLLNKVMEKLKQLDYDEFNEFYRANEQDFIDFSNFYEDIKKKGELGEYKNGLKKNLNTLLENLESWFAS